jgi:hypothetical protein
MEIACTTVSDISSKLVEEMEYVAIYDFASNMARVVPTTLTIHVLLFSQMTASLLRAMASNFMLENPDEFTPFMVDTDSTESTLRCL